MITFTLRIVLFQEITFQYVMPLVVLAVRFFLTLILNYLLDYFFFDIIETIMIMLHMNVVIVNLLNKDCSDWIAGYKNYE